MPSVFGEFSFTCADARAPSGQHKYSRAKLGDDFEEKLLELSTNVNVIVSHSNDGYTCVLKNGYVEVKNLPDDHEAALRFKKPQEENVPMPALLGRIGQS